MIIQFNSIYSSQDFLDPAHVNPALLFILKVLDQDRIRLDKSFDSIFFSKYMPELLETYLKSSEDQTMPIIDFSEGKKVVEAASCTDSPSSLSSIHEDDICVYYSDFSV